MLRPSFFSTLSSASGNGLLSNNHSPKVLESSMQAAGACRCQACDVLSCLLRDFGMSDFDTNRESSRLSLTRSPPTCKQTLMSLRGRPSLNFESSSTSFLLILHIKEWKNSGLLNKYTSMQHSFFTNNEWMNHLDVPLKSLPTFSQKYLGASPPSWRPRLFHVKTHQDDITWMEMTSLCHRVTVKTWKPSTIHPKLHLWRPWPTMKATRPFS